MKKRNVIIATSILIATLSVGGTTYAVNKNHANKVNHAKLELKDEMKTINSIRSELGSYLDKDGFLLEGLTLEKFTKFKKSLNSIKDNYKDLGIKKDDLKNEIKVVKIDKKSLEKEFAVIESKLQMQTEVNNLFLNAAITGTTVTVQQIKDDVTLDKINEVKEKVVKDQSNWGIEVNKLVLEAESQLKQIETATNKVNGLFVNGVVNADVTISTYNEVKGELDKISNGKFKTELTSKLNEVLVIAEANQKKAEEEAIVKAEQEALAKNNKSTNSASKSSGTTSSQNKSTSQSSSGGTTSGGGTSSDSASVQGQVSDVQKTGEGRIKEADGTDSTRTYEEGTFEWGGY